MTEVTDRQQTRDAIAAGGWTIIYGDLINEGDLLTLAISVPTGNIATWVNLQVEAQLQHFAQSMASVSDDVVQQASNYLKHLLKANRSGEMDINGLKVKGGFATYHRKMVFRIGGRKIGQSALPINKQPYIGVLVSRALPPKGTKAAALVEDVSLDSQSWYKIKNDAKPGMALDVVNDGNQQNDGQLQLAAEGNFSGQYWQLRPSKTMPGAYNLCTMWLGVSRCLDVYGDDKTAPHLTTAGAFSGQQWDVQGLPNGTVRLTNSYSGQLVLAVDTTGNELHLKDPQSSPAAQQWTLEVVRPITESGFAV